MHLKETEAVFFKAKGLLERGWFREHYAADMYFREVDVFSKKAVYFNPLSAIQRASRNNELFKYCRQFFAKIIGFRSYLSIYYWNRITPKERIIDAFDRAILNLEYEDDFYRIHQRAFRGTLSDIKLAFSDARNLQSNWTKGCFARNKYLEAVSPHDDDAFYFCPIGAMIKVCGRNEEMLGECLKLFMDILGLKNIAGWNDNKFMTKERVAASFDKVIAALPE